MKILVAVDGSEAALRGVRFAGRLASELAHCSLALLFVRPSHTGALVGLGAPPPRDEERLEEKVRAAEREVLGEAQRVLGERGLEAAELVETGAPAPAICRVARRDGFDLIVLGSRGHGELKSVLLGSTSDAVIHGASCPVLVVR